MSLTEAEKKAFAIYEMISSSTADRPFAFDSVEQLWSETTAWKAKNPALSELSRAAPQVLLERSFEWLSSEAQFDRNFRALHTLSDGILHALTVAPKPLPAETCSPAASRVSQANGLDGPDLLSVPAFSFPAETGASNPFPANPRALLRDRQRSGTPLKMACR